MGPIYFFESDKAKPSFVSPNRFLDLPIHDELKQALKGTLENINSTTNDGPTGKPGFLVSICPNVKGQIPPGLDYVPEKQTWSKVYAGDQFYWYGYYTENPVKPIDLQRQAEMIVPGHPVKLNDGNEWIVPVVSPNINYLPKRWVRREGVVVAEVEDKWKWACEASMKWYELCVIGSRGEKASWTFGEMLEYAHSLLAINYRIMEDEMLGEALNLITANVFYGMMHVSLGCVEMERERAAKKKEEEVPHDS